MNNFSKAELIEIVDEAISKNGMESRLTAVESECHKTRILLEDLDKKFDLMLEIISPTVKKAEKLDDIESTLDDHGVRIKVLEHSFQQHAKNNKAHDKTTS